MSSPAVSSGPAAAPSAVKRPVRLIGDQINHAFARPKRAWPDRNVAGYQEVARTQVERGADFLDVNIDATQTLQVRMEEMLEFLPKLIPALQEVTKVPLCFDNPSIRYQRVALEHYDRSRSPAPILNSVAASRENLDEMIALVKQYDTWVIAMCSEKFTAEGGSPCASAEDVYETTKRFVGMLVDKAQRRPEQIIVDPGLAPVGADTYGLVNMGLDAMRLIRQDPNLKGVHISVGLSNFSFGVPKTLRDDLESGYITLAMEAGLDFILASADKNHRVLPPDDRIIQVLKKALAAGRPKPGESQEDAGFRQAETIMELF